MKTTRLVMWAGRIGGFIFSCLFLAFLIGEAADGLFRNAGLPFIKFVPLLALAISGYVVAWFKPKIGGAITILGGMLMLDFHLLREDLLTAAVFGLPFILVGILFMLSASTIIYPKKKPS